MTADGAIAMHDQASTPARRNSESDWWMRLASFAEQTEAERSGQVVPKLKAPLSAQQCSRKRGFRINRWRPFSLLEAGPAVLERGHRARLQRLFLERGWIIRMKVRFQLR